MKKNSAYFSLVVSLVFVLLTLGILSFVPNVRSVAESIASEVWLRTSPSADVAYVRANMHFSSRNPEQYDPELAKKLYTRALERDSMKPLVRHQLARLEFLEGDFDRALALIEEEMALPGGPSSPTSYYVKALIEGFMGEYVASARDYETYLRTDSTNWAAINDYAWVLLKNNEPRKALVALDWGIMHWPTNPWLHNTRTTALYELGYVELAYQSAQQALLAVDSLTENAWLQAYPGNDPLIAPEGVQAFKTAVSENMHSMILAHDSAQK